MEKSYKYRLYPNKKQKEMLSKTFGCTRFIYNYYLNKKIELYKNEKQNMTRFQCDKDMTSLKQELIWLKEVDKFALQNALKDLDRAYQNFIKLGKGYPKFKSKKNNKHSYRTQYTKTSAGGNIMILDKHIKLPKLGNVKIRNKLIPQGRILNATISQEPNGHYYVSICCTDVNIEQLSKTNFNIGIDLGLTHFAITSDGEKVENPRYLQKSLKKLAKLQKRLSRKSIGGHNRNKARIKVAKQYAKISNQRKDFLQKLSTKFIRENDIICLETLKISEMLQEKKMSRSIADTSWSEFVRMLEYKADWYGRMISKIDTYYPSSQICSCCGHRDGKKTLNIREWICSNCNTLLDRDVNASINILNEGLRIMQ